MDNVLNSTEIEMITGHYGIKFFNKTSRAIDTLTEKWQITDLKLIDSFSSSLVLRGKSAEYGDIIFKIARNQSEFNNEVSALKYFNDSSICRLYEVDYENEVLLIEEISPGNTLYEENNLNKRIEVFCDLYNTMHSNNDEIKSCDFEKSYQSYNDWVFRITEYMSTKEDWNELAIHMEYSKEIYIELSKEYPAVELLHGDFHYYNILKSKDGYKVIDPKGVIGNPLFDVPRYILNEYWDTEDKSMKLQTVKEVIHLISEYLEIDEKVLKKLLYIEASMAMSWFVESGMKLEEKNDVIESLNMLQSFMNN